LSPQGEPDSVVNDVEEVVVDVLTSSTVLRSADTAGTFGIEEGEREVHGRAVGELSLEDVAARLVPTNNFAR
jgi:hypothetical protein